MNDQPSGVAETPHSDRLEETRRTLASYRRFIRSGGDGSGGALFAYLRDVPVLLELLAAPAVPASPPQPEGETHTFGGTYDDPPHCSDDYRDVWRSGFRAGRENAAVIEAANREHRESRQAVLREALESARFYVEAYAGAKGLTAGMAEQQLARIDAALLPEACPTVDQRGPKP